MRYDLKSFVELDCDDIDVIKNKTLTFIKKTVGVEKPHIPWIFLNLKELLNAVPEYVFYFKTHKLIPRHSACTILYEDLSLHIDTPPIIAKMNFPIYNTQGWTNKWYTSEIKMIDTLQYAKDPLGFDNLNTNNLNKNDLILLTELQNFSKPIILNSQQLHSVEKTYQSQMPRIITSFTFYNDPWELLL